MAQNPPVRYRIVEINRTILYATYHAMRAGNILCDAVLEVEDERFNIHKCMLVACSNYFAIMFLHDFGDRRAAVIQMRGVSSRSIKDLIEYAYTGRIILSEDSAIELWRDTDYLMFQDLSTACANFLISIIDNRNVCKIYDMAFLLNSARVMSACLNYVDKHFVEIAVTSEFDETRYGILRNIVLRVRDSRDFSIDSRLRAVAKWVNKDLEERLEFVIELLEACNFKHLSVLHVVHHCSLYQELDPVRAVQLAQMAVLHFDRERQTIANEADEYFIFIMSRFRNSYSRCISMEGEQSSVFIPRNYDSEIGYCYATANDKFYTFNKSRTQVYQPQVRRWINRATMSHGRRYAAVTYYRGYFYVCGGLTNPNACSDIVERYDPRRDTWKTLPPMRVKRCHFSVVAYRGYLYAIGGSLDNDLSPYDDVERYDFTTKQWTILEDLRLNTARSRCPAIVFDGKIFVCGGMGRDARPLRSVEYYDPANLGWRYASSMHLAKSDATIIVWLGRMLLFGGIHDYRYLKDSESYDHLYDFWEFQRPINDLSGPVAVSVLRRPRPELQAQQQQQQQQQQPIEIVELD